MNYYSCNAIRASLNLRSVQTRLANICILFITNDDCVQMAFNRMHCIFYVYAICVQSAYSFDVQTWATNVYLESQIITKSLGSCENALNVC